MTRSLSSTRAASAVLAVALALSGLALAPAAPAGAAETAITEAPALEWGFKRSWRAYASTVAVSDGTTVVPATDDDPYQLRWAFASGSYDPDTRTTVLRYEGTAHWTKYRASELGMTAPPGYSGPPDPYILDVTVSDPIVTISRDTSTISVEARSRQLATWELLDLGRTAITDLDIGSATPTVDATTTTWSGIPASLTDGAAPVFGAGYRTGTAVDPVGFAYTGPGGAPDLSEVWDEPGTALLEQTGNVIAVDAAADTTIASSTIQPWWVDDAGLLVHYRWRATIGGAATWTYQAFDLTTLAPVGEPLLVPHAQRLFETGLWDRATGRLFYTLPAESGQGVHRWIRFDRATGQYVRGETDPLPAGSYLWDEQRGAAYRIEAADGGWRIVAQVAGDDGSWTEEVHTLPAGPVAGGIGFDTSLITPSALEMADGTIVVLGAAAADGPAEVPAAWRISLHDDGTAERQPVAGATMPNPGASLFSTLEPGPDGQVTLVKDTGQVRLQDTWPATGEAGPLVDLTARADTTTAGSVAIDPTDGMAWVGGYASQRLWGVRDGRVVADQQLPLKHPRGGPVVVGPDHTVYAQSFDGSEIGFGGTSIFGLGRFERLGLSPTVTEDPADAAVALGPGEASEAVTFTAAATGDPAPTRQWQVRTPGSARFADVEGETGETLAVTAVPGMDGTEYRALYANAAGRRPSEPAVLTVEHAPAIAFPPVDATVIAGADATFDLAVTGTPEPEVTWQRYAGGFWWNIGPDDDGLVISDGRLTVTGTDVDQDGSRFRARVRNALGTVHTRAATLTVRPPHDGPQHVVGGDLDWGVRESFRTYITGPIAHGAIGVSDGAVANPDGTFGFPAAGGTVEGGAIDAGFGGVVRFTGHDGTGTPAGVPALDVRISDIRVAVDGQDGELVADVTARGLSDGTVTTYDDIAFATLDLSGVAPTPVEGGLRWAAVPATLTEAGVPAFEEFYEAGSALDPVTLTLELSDDEPDPPLTPVESFATAALTDLLGDTPTEQQVAGAAATVEAVGKAAFLRTLTTSDEWLTALVQDLYEDTLGRPASQADLDFWAGRIRSGWTVARVAASFYAAAEYYEGIGGGTDATWVADLYESLLGRAADGPGRDYWVAETQAKGRGNVALRFFQSPESSHTRVRELYQHLLGRAPSPGDLGFWGPQVVRRGDLALAVSLAASAEYQARAEARFP